jgi:hypothetical protein
VLLAQNVEKRVAKALGAAFDQADLTHGAVHEHGHAPAKTQPGEVRA